MDGRAVAVNLLVEDQVASRQSEQFASVGPNAEVIRRFRSDGIFGLGETYMQGLWDAQQLDKLMYHIFIRSEASHFQYPWTTLLRQILRQTFFNPQSGRAAFNIGKKHYDLGNDLFCCMLDESMTYTCGYWQKASNLNDAQEAKLDLTCRKLKLESGMRVLDIGCGWGNFACYAAEHYGVSVTGVTVSEEQAKLARERCKDYPVEILLQDYRTIDNSYDRVVSLEMIEAVGQRNLPCFFETVERCLADDGLFLLQAISADTFSSSSDPRLNQFVLWILKYIFPDGYLPRTSELAQADKKGFIIEDWHGFGPDYDKTLMAWAQNFNRSWPALQEKYGEKFKRRWDFYLYSCAALFRARLTQLYQIVYSKGRAPSRYRFER